MRVTHSHAVRALARGIFRAIFPLIPAAVSGTGEDPQRLVGQNQPRAARAIIWLVFLCAAATGMAQEPADFQRLAEAATRARRDQRAEEAVRLYREAVQLQPSFLEGWWYLGLLQHAGNRFEEAAAAFERLVSLQPRGGEGWAMLGMCRFRLRQFEASFNAFDRARSETFEQGSSLRYMTEYHLALLLNLRGEFERSLRLLQGWIRPGQPDPRLLEAIGLSVLALPLLPADVPETHRDLVKSAGEAEHAAGMGRIGQARALYEKLLLRHPAEPNVHYRYGVLCMIDNFEAALAAFQRVLELYPEHVSAKVQLAHVYLARGETAPAVRYAREAVSAAPGLAAARSILGRALLEADRIEEAVREFEAGTRLDPDSAELFYNLGRAYARAGRKDDAARARSRFQELENGKGGQAHEAKP